MKLQNNYTTPEQSQRLLDLGIPVKSADCYYMIISGKIDNQIEVICDLDTLRANCDYLRDYFPCWSVGRLMEILRKCIERNDDKEVIFMDLTYKQGPIVNLLIDVFEHMPVMDLSKLED